MESLVSFFSPLKEGDPFIIFSLEHNLFMLSVIGLILLMYLLKDYIINKGLQNKVRLFIIIALLISEGSLHVWRFLIGKWSVQTSLPLHLCGISIIMSIIMLINKKYFIFELTYFWGLIGAVLAIITPALDITYTHYRFWQFLTAHAFIVLAVMYMIIIEGYRPRYKSIWKTYLATNLLMFFIAGINWLIESNYLYLRTKPVSSSKTLFDFLGPWPWYILSLEILAVIAFHLWYLPWWFDQKMSGNSIINDDSNAFKSL